MTEEERGAAPGDPSSDLAALSGDSRASSLPQDAEPIDGGSGVTAGMAGSPDEPPAGNAQMGTPEATDRPRTPRSGTAADDDPAAPQVVARPGGTPERDATLPNPTDAGNPVDGSGVPLPAWPAPATAPADDAASIPAAMAGATPTPALAAWPVLQRADPAASATPAAGRSEPSTSGALVIPAPDAAAPQAPAPTPIPRALPTFAPISEPDAAPGRTPVESPALPPAAIPGPPRASGGGAPSGPAPYESVAWPPQDRAFASTTLPPLTPTPPTRPEGAWGPTVTPSPDQARYGRPDPSAGSIFGGQGQPTPAPSFRQGPAPSISPDVVLPPVDRHDMSAQGYPSDIAVAREGRGRGRGLLTIVLALLFIVVAGAGGYGAAALISRTASAPTPSTTVPPSASPSSSASASASAAASNSARPSGSPVGSTSPNPSGSARPSSSSGPSGSPVPTPHVYTVVKGDTLQRIANRFGVTLVALEAANNITDPNKISVGQKLTIPPKP